jgi:hypothetical protein
MQFKVPQNVQRPDTIVGPITFKQLAILLVGGGLTYATFIILNKSFYWYVWVWPVAILGFLTLTIAFLKIHDMTFTKYVAYMFEFLTKPNDRYWRKGDMEFTQSILKPLQVDGEKAEENNDDIDPHEKRKKLEEVSNVLDNI